MSSEYRGPVFTGVVIQAVAGLAILTGMDELIQTYAFALVGFWIGTVVVICRRPQRPGRADLAFIRIGFIPVLVLGGILIECIWRLRGWRGF